MTEDSFGCDGTGRLGDSSEQTTCEAAQCVKIFHLECFTFGPSSVNPLAGVQGNLFDISVEVELGQAAAWGIKIRGEVVEYSTTDRVVRCLGSSAELLPDCRHVTLRVAVDNASLEVFSRSGEVLMRSPLASAEEAGLELYVVGGSIRVVSLAVHELRCAG